MWILQFSFHGGAAALYYLISGTYTAGRKREGCDIALVPDGAVDDRSVSRLHATFRVMPIMAQHAATATHIPELFVSDHSKHGTYINNVALLGHEEHRVLRPGDVVRFGQRVKCVVNYSPIVVAHSELLTSFQKREVQLLTSRIGGILSQPLAPDTLHAAGVPVFGFFYCTSEITGDDVQSLYAMLYGYTLVSPEYLNHLADVIKGSPTLPMSNWPQPRLLEPMKSRAFADRFYFRPQPTFFGLDEFLLRRQPRDTTHVFRSIRFVSLEPAVTSKYQRLVETAGGKLLETSAATVAQWFGSTAQQGRRSRDSSALCLMGVVPQLEDGHGFGTFVLCTKPQFLRLSHALTAETAAERNALRKQLEPLSKASEDSFVRRCGDDAVVAALLSLWERGASIIDEENIHAALYANDASQQLTPSSPGVLVRDAMDAVLEEDDMDSNATEEGILPYRPSATSGPQLPGSWSSPNRPLDAPSVRPCAAQQLAAAHKPRVRSSEAECVTPRNEVRAAHTTDLHAVWVTTRKSSTTTLDGQVRQSPARQLRSPTRVSSQSTPSNGVGAGLVSSTVRDSRTTSPIRSQLRPAHTRRSSFVGPVRPGPTCDRDLHALCDQFRTLVLPRLCGSVQQCCELVVRRHFVDTQCSATFESATTTFKEFLQALQEAESRLLVGQGLSTDTRRAAHSCRDMIDTVQRAIRASYRAVGIEPTAGRFVSPRRYSSPVSSRTVSPLRLQRVVQ